MGLILIRPQPDDARAVARLDGVLAAALAGLSYRTVASAEELTQLRGQRLLFAVALDAQGVGCEYLRILRRLRAEPEALAGCTSALLIDGPGELYTKSAAAELGLAVNLAGSALIGRPLVEATGSLTNFRVQAAIAHTDLAGAYRAAARELVLRLLDTELPRRAHPEILALHASSYRTSNTLQLWQEIKTRLGDGCTVTEIGLRNGAVSDCSGCPYTMCLHFGEEGRCFYGGVMTEEVWPAVRRCDALVLLCPNYNDALSANLTAFINRMTGLFRQTRFYDKALFAVVVSGYSGGDVVARQLVSALGMNKSFYLPPRFALLEVANDPGEALRLPGVGVRLDAFAAQIRNTLAGEKT